MKDKVQLNSRIDASAKKELLRLSRRSGLTVETIVADALAYFTGARDAVIDEHARLIRLVADTKVLHE